MTKPADGTALLLAIETAECAVTALVSMSRRVLLRAALGQQFSRRSANRTTNGNLGHRVTKLDRGVDETRVGFVVLDVICRDPHALADEVNRVGELGAEEVRKIVLLGPLLAEKVLRPKGGRPVY